MVFETFPDAIILLQSEDKVKEDEIENIKYLPIQLNTQAQRLFMLSDTTKI